MYRKRDRQISFDDFDQPFGLPLDPNNRWVLKASLVPWDDVEKEYSKRFPAKDGQVAKTSRMALGALIIQKEYGFSDEETAAMIQENPYFQYFCGIKKFTHEKPFDSSLMVHFRKRLTPEAIAAINEKIIMQVSQGKPQKTSPSDNVPDDPDKDVSGGLKSCTPSSNDAAVGQPKNSCRLKGTLIVDATCAPSEIKYPTDTDLLNKAREDTERMISAMHNPCHGRRPRTYARTSRKLFVNFSKKRSKKGKEIRRMKFRQLNCLKRNLGIIGTMLDSGMELPHKLLNRLEVVRKLYAQQKYMYENKTHTVEDRIVSLSQPWIRPIVRGKAKSRVEFGAKIDVSVTDGFTRLEKTSFSAYNESGELVSEIERYRLRTGHYPERVLADKIYRNRDNLKYCNARGIRLSGPALGRRPKGYVPDKARDYKDMCDRNAVERIFSLAKRKYGLGIIRARLQETAMSSIAISIMLLNLNKVFFSVFIFTQFYIIRTIAESIEERYRLVIQ
jgi:hypothetical protein